MAENEEKKDSQPAAAEPSQPAPAPAAEAAAPAMSGGGGGGGGGDRPSRGGGRDGGRRGRQEGGKSRGGGRDRGGDESGIESSVVRIYRCSKVVKGGRTFSFGALVVAGDRKGNVGIGYGKANEVPPAVEKATKDARKQMFKVNLKGTTIPHMVKGTNGASTVILVPARPGTGVTAGKSVRPCVELVGITDISDQGVWIDQPEESGEGDDGGAAAASEQGSGGAEPRRDAGKRRGRFGIGVGICRIGI